MSGRVTLDVVVRERAPELELLAREDQALLVQGDALLDVRRLDVERDSVMVLPVSVFTESASCGMDSCCPNADRELSASWSQNGYGYCVVVICCVLLLSLFGLLLQFSLSLLFVVAVAVAVAVVVVVAVCCLWLLLLLLLLSVAWCRRSKGPSSQ